MNSHPTSLVGSTDLHNKRVAMDAGRTFTCIRRGLILCIYSCSLENDRVFVQNWCLVWFFAIFNKTIPESENNYSDRVPWRLLYIHFQFIYIFIYFVPRALRRCEMFGTVKQISKLVLGENEIVFNQSAT